MIGELIGIFKVLPFGAKVFVVSAIIATFMIGTQKLGLIDWNNLVVVEKERGPSWQERKIQCDPKSPLYQHYEWRKKYC